MVRSSLPVRLLGALLLVAVFWFTVMFIYLGDLTREHNSGRHDDRKVTAEIKGGKSSQLTEIDRRKKSEMDIRKEMRKKVRKKQAKLLAERAGGRNRTSPAAKVRDGTPAAAMKATPLRSGHTAETRAANAKRPTTNSDGLTGDQALDRRDGHARHAFDVTSSDAKGLNRSVPDTRPAGCAPLADDVTMTASRLPATSVIICFHNEAWSTLLRTVHSVLDRTPAPLLQQVILVDDFSSYDYLGAPLDAAVSALPRVELVRTTKREGLVRARILGMSYARAEVLVFLDSHCEVNSGWLPPLLEQIVQDPHRIVSPELDIIDPSTFEYRSGPVGMVGAFDWFLQFTWKHASAREKGETSEEPIRTPVMIGGIFAVDRRYFKQLGSFDPGMEVWGGENLELSFRAWLCGASLWITPCSRVGHVFRDVVPYTFPLEGGAVTTVRHNAARVAETWLGRYKYFYYATQELPRNPAVAAAVRERLELRERLGCRGFAWFLRHVIPDAQLPPVRAQRWGNLKHGRSGLCLCAAALSGSGKATAPTLRPCDKFDPLQMFYMTSLPGELRFGAASCVSVTSQLRPVVAPCPEGGGKRWAFNGKTGALSTPHPASPSNATLCLASSHSAGDAHPDNAVADVNLTPCSVTLPHGDAVAMDTRRWTFTYRLNPSVLQYSEVDFSARGDG